MLIETAYSRYGGDPDPDEERERRWEPLSLRQFMPVAGSVSCLVVSAATTGAVAFLLTVAAIGLCLCFARAAWPRPGRD